MARSERMRMRPIARLAVVGLMLAVIVSMLVLRAWLLSQERWSPYAQADPALVKLSAASVRTTKEHLASGCVTASVPTRAWRLGSRLTFRVGRGAAFVGMHRRDLGRVLDRAAGAFGDRAGPCGRGPFRDWVAVAGPTGRNAGIDAVGSRTARCATADGMSVLDVGPLPGDFAGMACVWSAPDEHGIERVTEADIRLDAERSWVTGVVGCRAAYDVQSVLTHELGHVLGLDHPATGAIEGATMDRAVDLCDSSARTLTGGDLISLLDRLA